MTNGVPTDGQKEAAKTYLEQTKLLVALSSAFIFAPAGLVTLTKDSASIGLSNHQLRLFMTAEVFFIVSVLAGYVVLASIAGYQQANRFDVYRPATRYASLVQITVYLIGLVVFILLASSLAAPAAALQSRGCLPG
jgi:hypothetical protein